MKGLTISVTFFLAFEAAALEARPVGAKLSVLCFDEDAVAFFAGAFFAVVPVLLRIVGEKLMLMFNRIPTGKGTIE